MENGNEPVQETKQRHGCVTAWLMLMIVLNALTSFAYFFANDKVSQTFPGGISKTALILLGALGIGNIVFSILLLGWKKVGFWGFVATSAVVLVVNLIIGLSVTQSVMGLIGIVVLYGVLQIKKEDVSAWSNLE